MANVVVNINTSQDVGDLSFANWGKGRVSREVAKLIEGLGVGAFSGSLDVQAASSYGYGVLSLSGGAGADGGTIGGQLVTAAFTTNDANTTDLIAAAIIANATTTVYVTAASRTATGTLTIAAGSGVVTVILGSPGAGISPVQASVTWATSDTATAAALRDAVNATANSPVVASSSAGVVTFYSTLPGTGSTNTAGNSISLQGAGTNVTVSAATLTGGGTNANVLIKSLGAGGVGNGITLVASGTGVTAPTGARLVGGSGAVGNSFSC